MNEVIRQLFDRKSVRAFEDRDIGNEEKQLILESTLQAPTAGNMTLYTILDITDQNIKEQLADSCDHQPFIAKAKMVLVFCADYRRWYDVFCKYEDTVRKPACGDLFLAQQDTLIAAQNAVVAAESLGIGSCYIGDIIENFELHRELLNLPQYVVPACMVVFGYPTQQQKERPKPTRFRVEDIVHENGYDMEKSAAMEQMLLGRGEQDADWIRRFCKRKWNCAFSEEMSRSAKAILDSWISE
jgi:nitroreductase